MNAKRNPIANQRFINSSLVLYILTSKQAQLREGVRNTRDLFLTIDNSRRALSFTRRLLISGSNITSDLLQRISSLNLILIPSLTFGWMFEATIYSSTKDLGL